MVRIRFRCIINTKGTVKLSTIECKLTAELIRVVEMPFIPWKGMEIFFSFGKEDLDGFAVDSINYWDEKTNILDVDLKPESRDSTKKSFDEFVKLMLKNGWKKV